jgi:hypothetical protein
VWHSCTAENDLNNRDKCGKLTTVTLPIRTFGPYLALVHSSER